MCFGFGFLQLQVSSFLTPKKNTNYNVSLNLVFFPKKSMAINFILTSFGLRYRRLLGINNDVCTCIKEQISNQTNTIESNINLFAFNVLQMATSILIILF
jgi:hypothetical protein